PRVFALGRLGPRHAPVSGAAWGDEDEGDRRGARPLRGEVPPAARDVRSGVVEPGGPLPAPTPEQTNERVSRDTSCRRKHTREEDRGWYHSETSWLTRSRGVIATCMPTLSVA